MTLAKQVLPLPIVGGLSQKDDKVLSMRPRVMTNCVYRKSGSVSKRYGYDCIGQVNLGLLPDGTTSTPPTPEHLTTLDDELVRVGGGRLHSFATSAVGSGSETDWVERGLVPEALAQRTPISSTSRADIRAYPAVAVSGDFIISVYSQENSPGVRSIFVDVTSASTGTRLLGAKAVSSFTASVTAPFTKVVAVGDYAFIAWVDTSTSFIRGVYLQLSTLTFGTVANASASLSVLAPFDVAPVNANEFAILYNSGSNIFLRGITRTVSGSAFTVVGAALVLESSGDAQRVSLSYADGERFWCAWTWTDFVSTPYVRVRTVTPSYSVESLPFDAIVGATLSNQWVPAIARISPTRAVLVGNGKAARSDGLGSFFGDYPTLDVREINFAAPNTLSNVVTRGVDQFHALSRPFRQGERVYVHGFVPHTGASTPLLIDLYLSDTAGVAQTLPASGPRVVVVAMPRTMGVTAASGGVNVTVVTKFSPESIPDSPAIGAQERLVVQKITNGDDCDVLGLRFTWSFPRTSAQVGNLLLLGGGALTAFDGLSPCEVGFVHEPDSGATPTLVGSTGGSMTLLASYGYVYVFTWRDARGNVYRSAPSELKTITLTGTQRTVTHVMPELALTNKGALTAAERPSVEIYRTTANGSEATLTLVATVNIGVTVATMYTTYVDSASDVSIADNRALYSISAVDHVIPDGGNIVLAWKGGAVLAGTSEGSMWFSGGKLDDEDVWWNDSLAQPTFEGGPVTALGTIDDTIIAFKENGVFRFEGEGPADNGASTLSQPKSIQTDAGCVDAASVVSVAQGIIRKASTGIYMLARSLVDVPIGKGIEDAYRGSIVGAGVLASQGLVRWLQSGEGGADALVLDTFHWGALGVPVWSTDTLYDVRAGDTAQPVAAAVWRGSFVWLGANGFLYRESTSNFSDVDTRTGGNRWVSMSFETGFEKPGGISSFQRVWRALITAEASSRHDVSVTVTTERGSEAARTWTADQIAAFTGAPLERLAVHVAEQKCQWMSVRITDAQPTSPDGTRGGFILRDVSLELGVKPGGMRVPAANRR